MPKFIQNDHGQCLFQLTIGKYTVSVLETDLENFSDCRVLDNDTGKLVGGVGDKDTHDSQVAWIIARILRMTDEFAFAKVMEE